MVDYRPASHDFSVNLSVTRECHRHPRVSSDKIVGRRLKQNEPQFTV